MRIAVTGKARSGKDAVGDILLSFGFQKVRFAGSLKEMTRAHLRYYGVDDGTIEAMIEGDLKETPRPELNGKSPRQFMQLLGGDFGRKMIGEDFWVETEIGRGLPEYAVSLDVRYDNEALAMKKNGFIILGRIGGGLQGADAEHESEAGIDPALVDHWVPRYESTDILRDAVTSFVAQLAPADFDWRIRPSRA